MKNQKLFMLSKIRFENKNFVVFANETKKRFFLEIDDDNKNYKYPDIKDFIKLNNIYNNHNDRYQFLTKNIKKLLFTGVLVINPIVLSISTYTMIKTISETEKSIKNLNNNFNQCKRIDYNSAVVLANSDENILTVLENNQNLEEREKKYIKNFITLLLQKRPDADLTIFKYNLNDLKIVSLNKTEYEEKYGQNTIAVSKLDEKTIYYNSDYPLEEFLDHELCHLLNICYFEDKNVLYNVHGSKGFGNGLYEGFTSLFSENISGNIDCSYIDSQCIIKILSEIVGQDKVISYYLKGENIVNDLSKYDNPDEINKVIMMVDDLIKTKSTKIENTKDNYIYIASKLLKWSKISANMKYDELINAGISDDVCKKAIINQFTNIDLLLQNAFGFTSEEIRKLQLNTKIENDRIHYYDQYLNDKTFYEHNLNNKKESLHNKLYFVNQYEENSFDLILKNKENAYNK